MIALFKIRRIRFCLITLLFSTAILSGCGREPPVEGESKTQKQAAENATKHREFQWDSSAVWIQDPQRALLNSFADTAWQKGYQYRHNRTKSSSRYLLGEE